MVTFLRLCRLLSIAIVLNCINSAGLIVLAQDSFQQNPIRVSAIENNAEARSAQENQDALKLAIDGIAANYAKFESIKARLVFVSVYHDIKEAKERVLVLPNGGKTTIHETPARSSWHYFTLRGNDYRSKQYEIGDNGSKLTHVYRRQGDTLNAYYPKDNNTQSWNFSKSPGFVPMDPREFGGMSIKVGMLDTLRRSTIVETKWNGNFIEAKIIRRVTNEKNETSDHPSRYVFDSLKNYLPSKIIHYRETGLVNSVLDFQYEELLPGAWFIREFRQRYANQKEIREFDEQTQWYSTHRVYTVGKPEVNVPITEEDLALRPKNASGNSR